MDDRSIGGAELREALRHLRWINRLLGAFWPTLEGVASLWRGAGRPRTLRIVDVGAGSGEANRLLLRWARLRGIDLRIVLLDIHRDTCREAASYHQREPRIGVVQGDIFAMPVQGYDIATASLLLHHFPSGQIPRVLEALLGGGRLGVVVNDLHRHIFAWWSIRTLTRLLSRNRMIRNDAPLSVRRGFTSEELTRFAASPPLRGMRWRWRPMFRYLITIPQGEYRA